MRVAVLASGASLTDDDVDYVRKAREDGRLDYVLAVSDVGLLKTPWADALCSHDSGWWMSKKGAIKFAGRKFSARGYSITEQYDPRQNGFIHGGMNSGLFAMLIARDVYKATVIYLLGFDMHRRNGQHFFGKHTEIYNGRSLINTDEKRFKIHISQFDKFKGAEVYNCTHDSDLKRFPMARITDII